MKFSFNSQIRFSETGANGQLDLTSLIDYFQDCTTFHSQELGVGISYLQKQNLAWLMLSWQIHIKRYPSLGDAVRITTWATGFQAMYGYRNFTMTTPQGETLVEAYSVWALMNMKEHVPVKIPSSMAALYGTDAPLPLPVFPRKIRLPETSPESREPIPIGLASLDINHHVNNGQYIRMAENLLSFQEKTHVLRADYRKSALLGDRIYPRIYSGPQETIVSLEEESGNPYAILLFGRKESTC